MASEIRAGRAYVELFMKGDFKKSLDQASKQLKAFGDSVQDIGKKMAGFGAAITAPLILAAQRFAVMGDEIERASQRTGIGVDSLSALKYAAEQSGASFEDLEKGIQKMNKAIFEAEGGSQEAEKALAGIGLSVRDLQGLSPDQQFLKIGQALDTVQDAGAKSAIAMELFGKGGTALLPFFSRGADGIAELTKHAKELGLVMSGDDAKAATLFSEALADIWKQVDMVAFSVGAAVAQALMPFAQATTHILSSVIGWAKANRTLIIAVLGAGVAILSAGVALVGLGAAISLAGVAIEGIVTVFGLLSSAILLLLNPIVLIGGALIGLAVYFAVATKAGGECLAWLGDRFNLLKDTASEAFQGIADALGAGDILLAAKILWVGLQTVWAEGSQELMGYWYRFRAGFVQVAAAAFYGAEELWENVKAALMNSWADVSAYFQTLWQNTTAFLGGLWDGFINVFTGAWDTAVNAVSKGLNYIRSLWDKSFDPNEAAKVGDQMLADAQLQRDRANISAAQKREADRVSAIKDIEAQKQAKKSGINSDETNALKELEDKNNATRLGADQNAKDDTDALAKKKADLEKQLRDLTSKAKTEKANKKDDGPKPLDPSKLSLNSVLEGRESVTSAAKGQGIFGAQGIQSLQTGPAKDSKEIAKNTADAAKYLRDLARNKAAFK